MVKLALEGHVRRSTRQKFANTRLHNYHVSGLGIFFVYVGQFFLFYIYELVYNIGI